MIKNIGIIITLLLLVPVFTFAQQVNIPFALSNELNVDVNPDYPRPNENTTISLSLYSDDLTTATISWYQDDELVLSGIGKTIHQFTMGNVGEETKIRIVINLLNGISFSKQLSFTPASVDLVWEAESYVHPFYKGKALHPRQGSIKVVAVPEFYRNGNKIPAENLVYTWTNGLKAVQNQSGYGRNVVFLDGSLFGRTERIEVIVVDPINNLVASQVINIAPIAPEILFYENNPYYGYLFDVAIPNQFKLVSDEAEIVASPYFFTKEDVPFFNYNWRINNSTVPSIADSMSAIFRRPEESGRSQVSLEIANQSRLLQQAQKSFSINFD